MAADWTSVKLDGSNDAKTNVVEVREVAGGYIAIHIYYCESLVLIDGLLETLCSYLESRKAEIKECDIEVGWIHVEDGSVEQMATALSRVASLLKFTFSGEFVFHTLHARILHRLTQIRELFVPVVRLFSSAVSSLQAMEKLECAYINLELNGFTLGNTLGLLSNLKELNLGFDGDESPHDINDLVVGLARSQSLARLVLRELRALVWEKIAQSITKLDHLKNLEVGLILGQTHAGLVFAGSSLFQPGRLMNKLVFHGSASSGFQATVANVADFVGSPSSKKSRLQSLTINVARSEGKDRMEEANKLVTVIQRNHTLTTLSQHSGALFAKEPTYQLAIDGFLDMNHRGSRHLLQVPWLLFPGMTSVDLIYRHVHPSYSQCSYFSTNQCLEFGERSASDHSPFVASDDLSNCLATSVHSLCTLLFEPTTSFVISQALDGLEKLLRDEQQMTCETGDKLNKVAQYVIKVGGFNKMQSLQAEYSGSMIAKRCDSISETYF